MFRFDPTGESAKEKAIKDTISKAKKENKWAGSTIDPATLPQGGDRPKVIAPVLPPELGRLLAIAMQMNKTSDSEETTQFTGQTIGAAIEAFALWVVNTDLNNVSQVRERIGQALPDIKQVQRDIATGTPEEFSFRWGLPSHAGCMALAGLITRLVNNEADYAAFRASWHKVINDQPEEGNK